MRIYFFIIILFSSGMGFCQTEEDSLLRVINGNNSDTAKVNAFHSLAHLFSGSDPSKSLIYSSKGLELAERMNFLLAQSMLYNQKGLAYRSKGNTEKALSNLLKAAEINLKLGKSSELNLAANYGNIGGIYQKRGEHTGNKIFSKKAIEYYALASTIFTKRGNKNGIAGCHLEMGIILHDLNDDSLALIEYQKALKIVEEMKFDYGIRVVTNNMANSLRALKRFKESENLFKNNLEQDIKLRDTSAIIGSLNNLASLAIEKEHWNEAIKHALKALELTSFKKEPDDIHLSASCLAKAYEKIKNYERAVEYYKLKEQYKDTLVNVSSNQQLAEMEGKFQNEKKELEIVSLNKEKLLQQSEIKHQQAESKRQSLQKMAFASGFALMLILAVIVLRSYNQKKKDNKIILHQKELVEEKQKEILDSIRYAKRIQQSLLPSEKYIAKKLKDFNG